jgi:predicted RNase H-like HicB family nuclease
MRSRAKRKRYAKSQGTCVKEAVTEMTNTNATELRYAMVIEWSDEDEAFLVTLPEWADQVNTPTTHGATYEDAVRNGHEALRDLIALAQERGQPLPAPRVHAG